MWTRLLYDLSKRTKKDVQTTFNKVHSDMEKNAKVRQLRLRV